MEEFLLVLCGIVKACFNLSLKLFQNSLLHSFNIKPSFEQICPKFHEFLLIKRLFG
jgi:hypothetical protein